MHSLKSHAIRGFTMIELMITLAIVGVLTAIAIPMYADYTVKVKVNQAIAALHAQSLELESHFQESLDFKFLATSSTKASIPGFDGGTIGWTTKDDGRAVHIEAWLGENLYDGATDQTMIVYEGIADTYGNVSWRCAYHNILTRRIKSDYEPAECSSVVSDEF